ncbi:unnamed protein product [Clonostachys solani]|uniref:Alpha-type protein kinase domain-containing protein n=1 Tax=Clonostachys solani TaxID=160281 RepID=A0A9N9ZMW5_9HYPO|nr:unnamed protein product [Clonostachys solani]
MSPPRHTFTAASTIRGDSQQDLESLADSLLDSSISQTKNGSKPPSETSGFRRDTAAFSTGRAKRDSRRAGDNFAPTHTTSSSVSRSRATSGHTGSFADLLPKSNAPRERRESSARGSSSRFDSSRYSHTQKEDSSRASVSSSTTSKTRERLREVELERDKLLRDVAYGKGVVERLKKEGAATELVASRTKASVERLKTEAYREGLKVSKSGTDGFFKKASSTDLLFLMDTTSSMDPYMNEAKAQVRSIIDEIREAFFGEAEVRISIVSYKDHGDEPNIQWLDFTPDADAARAFLENLYAEGGGDPPEDVLGGIQQAINASWRAYTRCMIHIADSPPHGRIFHDSDDDTYPEPGSEPHRLTYKPLIRKLTELRINYALIRTGEYTDKMADLFMQEYKPAATVCRLHKSNGYYPLSMDKGTLNTGSHHPGQLVSGKKGIQFQELELGTTYSALRHLIVQSVTSSASLTATYLANRRAPVARATAKGRDPRLTLVEEENEGLDDIKISLETSPPKWDSLSWFGEKVNVEGFSPTVIVHGFQTLNDMMASDDNIIMSPVELSLRWRSKPFSNGATRQASYARTEASTDRFVVKSPLKSSTKMVHLVEDMRCQALCRAFALEFNGLVGYRFSLNFIVTICFEGRDKVTSDADCLSLEPFIPGHYVKYNGNNGWLPDDLEDNDIFKACQAFSHFTYERSLGEFLVCDLQGVNNLLTDPAIHTYDLERFKLSATNCNMAGIKFFFVSHRCNEICSSLGLQSTANGLKTGSQNFRTDWPSVESTLFCSNKLCGQIVYASHAKQSTEYPGCSWCEECWPQLESSKTTRLCVGPGSDHEFEVSKFFFESQGSRLPRECPMHRTMEKDLSEAASTSRKGLWARLKSRAKRMT